MLSFGIIVRNKATYKIQCKDWNKMSWNKDEEIPQNITNGENRKPKKKTKGSKGKRIKEKRREETKEKEKT